jgi:hypothetical protein
MAFAYTARGTKEQTLDSLRALTPSYMGHDALGVAVRDLLVEHIELGAEPAGRYYVHASGDGDPATGPVQLSVTVSTDGQKDEITGLGGLKLPAVGYRSPRRPDYDMPIPTMIRDRRPLGSGPDWSA